MTRTYFITGTDTGVGKTLVAASLLCLASEAGFVTAAVKPVAAGCNNSGENEDALILRSVMDVALAYQQINPVALGPAIAPHIAAAQAGTHLRAARLAGYCRNVMMSEADFVVIEGAGGWRVPLNSHETFASLAVELQVPVIMVVAMRLGCINHALLTAEAIASDGLSLTGWVANTTGAEMDSYRENLQSLQSRLGAPLLGEIPGLSDPEPRKAAAFLKLPDSALSD